MKQQDFDRLKAKLGDEFEAYNNEYGVVIVEKKKDIWEGVEFVEDKISHKVYILNRFVDKDSFTMSFYKPSTESAYVDQLKKEAFERFGEIKDGDRFYMTNGYTSSIRLLACDENNWFYSKKLDKLSLHGFTLYQSGKWATRVNKRIEVVFLLTESDDKQFKVKFGLPDAINHMKNFKGGDCGRFLASQLEKYLNGEL